MITRAVKRSKSGGFTLVEALLAAAIFGMSGFLLALAFNNGQRALLNWESNTEVEKVYDWAIQKIDIKNLSKEQIEEGGDLLSLEGYRIEWYGEVIPTETLDLFVVEYWVTISDGSNLLKENLETRLYFHDQWYEDDEREKLIEEKEERFEEIIAERRRR